MKTYTVGFKFIGLAGSYLVEREIKARTFESLRKKAWAIVGDRTVDGIWAKYRDPKSAHADAHGLVLQAIYGEYPSVYNSARA